jgi:DNA (cytosine-5)-methyltransferase 1
MDKYYLSETVKNYVLATGTKDFYSKPETDLEIARPLLSTMAKMHRAGVDNYVTRGKRLRKLTPRECLRLMGFPDDFKIVVSDTQMYKQTGNSIVVDVLIHILLAIYGADYSEVQNEKL